MTIILSNIKTRGNFKWRSVDNLKVTFKDCLLLSNIVEDNGNFLFSIQVNKTTLDQFQLQEIELRKQLSKDNCYLKGKNIENNIINLTLWSTKKSIKTHIYDLNGGQILYNTLNKDQHIDIDFVIDSVWAHKQYYPNFVYKLKPEFIYVCE